MEKFGKFICWVLVSMLAAIVSGAVVSTLWGWFIVPSLGLNTISIAEGAGAAILVRYLVPKVSSNKGLGEAALDTVTLGLAALGIGYLLTLFI